MLETSDQGTTLLKVEQWVVLQNRENKKGEGRGFSHEQCTGSSLLLLFHLLAADCPPPSHHSFTRGHAPAHGGNTKQLQALSGCFAHAHLVVKTRFGHRLLFSFLYSTARLGEPADQIHRDRRTSAQLLAYIASLYPRAPPRTAQAASCHQSWPRDPFPLR
jgi:hypothetical protein